MRAAPQRRGGSRLLRAWLPGAVAAAALVAGLAGCHAVGHLLTVEEQGAVARGELTAVLVRVDCTVDGRPVPAFPTPYRSIWNDIPEAPGGNMEFGSGDFESGGEIVQIENGFLTEDSARTGWTYFLLGPGITYLFLSTAEGTSGWRRSGAPLWRIDVANGANLLYAGTLRLEGKGEKQLWLKSPVLAEIRGEPTMADEREEAMALLREHFPGAGPPETSLMRRWANGEPLVLHAPVQAPAPRRSGAGRTRRH